MSYIILRASAKAFIPSSKSHIVAKRVSWHPEGITSVRHFIIEPCAALPSRVLKGVPISAITVANKGEAMPFIIPPPPPYFEHLCEIHAQRPTIKEPLIRQNAVKDNFWKQWCE